MLPFVFGIALFPGHSHRQYFIASSMKYGGVFHTEILAVGMAWEQCGYVFGAFVIYIAYCVRRCNLASIQGFLVSTPPVFDHLQ